MEAVTSISGMVVALEGHGREHIHIPMRAERTVGWFTSVYPFALQSGTLAERLIKIKEMLVHIPGNGMGFGMLRMRERALEKTGDIAAYSPALLLNYLGEGHMASYQNFAWSEFPEQKDISPLNGEKECIVCNVRRCAALNGEDMASAGSLWIEMSWDSDKYDSKTVLEFLDHFCENLSEAAQEQKKLTVQLTPSDVSRLMIPWESFKVCTTLFGEQEIEGIFKLTPLQSGMLFHYLANPSTEEYINQDLLTVREEVDIDLLAQACSLLGTRFDALRMAFVYQNVKEPYQVLLKSRRPQVRIVPIQNHPEQEKEIISSELAHGFDLSKDSLMRVVIMPMMTEEKEITVHICLTMHHIIVDGWSFPLLLSGLFDSYQALCEQRDGNTGTICMLPEHAAFREYLEWQQEQDMDHAAAYWEDMLAGYEGNAFIEPYPQSMEAGGSVISKHGAACAVERCVLSHNAADKLICFAKNNGITVSTLFETAWGLVLHAYTGTDDVVFGKTVSGRNILLPGIEQAVGLFINTVPVRVRAKKGDTLLSLLKRQKEQAVEGLPYEHAALSGLQRRTEKKRELIQTLFVYENFHTDIKRAGGGYSITAKSVHEQTNYPLVFYVEQEGSFCLNLLYHTSVYGSAQVGEILACAKRTLMQLADNPETLVDKRLLSDAGEREHVFAMACGREVSYPQKTVVSLLYEYACSQPDHPALLMGEKSVSYRCLYMASGQIAAALGIGLERTILLIAQRSPQMIAAVFGILMAGAAYVPVDPSCPYERIQFLIKDCQPEKIVVFCPGEDRTWMPFLKSQAEVIDLSLPEWKTLFFDRRHMHTCDMPDIGDRQLFERLAYVIYTSGTSGKPKGVLIGHDSLSNMVYANADWYGFTKHDRVLQLASYVFDQSVWDIFGTIGTGGTLCLITKEEMASAEGIEQVCRRYGVTVLMTTSMMLGMLHPDRMGTALRLVSGGGDSASADIFARWNTVCVNSYGPTEITVNASAFRYQKGIYGAVPIGSPLPNKKILILNKERLCGVGMRGEICIAGKGLARGYLGREELTEKQFICLAGERIYRTGDFGRYLPDGNIQYLGRMDGQIKIRGFRVELQEIEQCLLSFPQVLEAAVRVIEKEHGRFLCGYVTTKQGTEPDTAQILGKLRRKLPGYMVPSALVLLDNMPLKQSGKIDREALPEPVLVQNVYEPPQNQDERIIAECFACVLGLSKVGRREDFFHLGGDSIRVMTLAAELSTEPVLSGIEVSDILRAPTPADLAALVSSRAGRPAKTDMTGFEKKGFFLWRQMEKKKPSCYLFPPSGGTLVSWRSFLESRFFREHIGIVWGMEDPAFAEWKYVQKEDLRELINRMPQKEMWRKTLQQYKEALLKVWTENSFLAGYSQGGILAFHAAQALEKLGHCVGGVIVLDAVPLTRAEAGRQALKEKETLALFSSMTGVVSEHTGEFTKEQMFAYAVLRKNTSMLLPVEGSIKAPLLSVSLNNKNGENDGIARAVPHSVWESYVQGAVKAYEISCHGDEHLVFLEKYKQELDILLCHVFSV